MALVPCQVLRVAILLSYCSILCNYKAIEMPSHQTYGGSWKFLTFIDLFVVAVFWIIYAYDREMIYPKLLDNFIPGWLNHGMHTTVLPFILIEMRTSHHQYPSRSSGLTAICTFSVGYILWALFSSIVVWPLEQERSLVYRTRTKLLRCVCSPPSPVLNPSSLRILICKKGVLGASCHRHVGVPFPGTHRLRSQNRLLWVDNHLDELSVPSGRSSEQLYLGYTEKYGRREREA
ncbi:androgen-induced gene 1 protein isoform X3 [Heterocephalus glaber]|uniref:Androgen-induced gene 1 protein isoform X3 n=1 Tax=Heterocephalus glaber TaxID=10181 RepID=A0AAX6T367_HETGA|nr:androgen-induced gene 1 protein isoform X3 [Heterocephalus glaber]